MGSVKDLEILEMPISLNFGRARFIFSDRYSVFDWGEMPDHIPFKGEATLLLASYFFEKIEENGIPTHYIGLLEENKIKKLSELKNRTNIMEIKFLRVIRPIFKENKYDYSAYKNERGNFLIPLEVIYRNYLPEGSSIFKRLKEGLIKPKDIGLDKEPFPGQKLERPIIDVSTKLENPDRYLTWEEAKEISGLSYDEVEEMKRITNKINELITYEFSKIGLINEDGKIEFGFDGNRNLMVVDVVGTLDECRFKYEGIPVSKEIARIYYRNTDWYKEIEEVKKKYKENWKKMCKLSPEPLPERLKILISQVYCACTNEITQREWFKGIPPLKEILKEIKEILKL